MRQKTSNVVKDLRITCIVGHKPMWSLSCCQGRPVGASPPWGLESSDSGATELFAVLAKNDASV
jgi:hypothetical protein